MLNRGEMKACIKDVLSQDMTREELVEEMYILYYKFANAHKRNRFDKFNYGDLRVMEDALRHVPENRLRNELQVELGEEIRDWQEEWKEKCR